jgi:arabinose-5-phosphate isomerase
MKKPPLPSVMATSGVSDIIQTMSSGRLGLCLVTDAQGQIQGLISDGDLRRAMIRLGDQFLQATAEVLMTASPKSISPAARLGEAEQMMTEHKITALLVKEGDQVLGVVEIYDIK